MAAIYRINYKSDFLLTLYCDAGWATPFCLKFWTGAPSKAYFAGYDGENYTHCAPDAEDPLKLVVQFDDHHLPVGDLKFQVSYHFAVADFPDDTEDEVLNAANITTEIDGEQAQVMLDFNGETAPEIAFSLPAYAAEAQRIANEEQRIANEQQRIDNEQTRINQESARVNEYAELKADAVAATGAANDAAALANQKAGLAGDAATLATQKAGLADDAATLATQKAGLADDAATLATQKAGLADDAATLATQKAGLADDATTLATQKAQYAQDEGDYAKAQGDYAKSQADLIPADVMRTALDATFANANHEALFYMRQADEHLAGLMTSAEHNKLAALPTDADLETGIIYDVSALHPTSGVSGGSTYASLSAALAVIPQAKRKGGMSVKFVLSSDNHYVQFRYMGTDTTGTPNPFLDTTNWQGIDNEPTAGSKNLVESGGVYDATQYSIYNPLAGVTFGNLSGDSIVRDTLKEVWLEVIDSLFVIPTSFVFILYRNRASGGCVIQLNDSNGNLAFSYTYGSKLVGSNNLTINGYSSYNGKLKLHVKVDFSSHSEDINYGALLLATTLTSASLNRSTGTAISMRQQVAKNTEDIDKNNTYSKSLYGCEINDAELKSVIKNMWWQKLDNTVTVPDGVKIYLRNTTDNGFTFTVQDAEDNYILSKYTTSPLSEGIHNLILKGYGSYYYDRITIHLTVDMPEVFNGRTITDSKIVFEELPTYPQGDVTINEQVAELSKPWKDKTIVCFGDSITEFHDEKMLRYSDYLHIMTGANVINVGVGGTQFRQRTTPVLSPTTSTEGYAGLDIVNMVRAAAEVEFDATHTYRDIVQNAADAVFTLTGDDNRIIVSNLLSIDWTKVDAVTFFGGVNDWTNGGQMGVSGSTNPADTLGAINVIIQTMLTKYPYLSLYWFTPTVRWAANLADRIDSNWSDVEVIGGITLKEFSASVKTEVELQHTPVCDLYNTLGWNKWNFGEYYRDNDGVHPYKGFEFIAKKMAAFLDGNKTF